MSDPINQMKNKKDLNVEDKQTACPLQSVRLSVRSVYWTSCSFCAINHQRID